jgi:hypothetical protein
MRLSCSFILCASALASVALPTVLRAQTPAPETLSKLESQAVAESDPGLHEIERKVVLKHFSAAVKELKGVEEALMNATTPEQKAVASKVAEIHRKWVEELKARLAQVEPADDPKTAAMTKKLDAIVIRYSAFRDATLSEVVHHLINRGKEADPDKTGVPIRFSVMDNEDESPITFHLENATLHLLLQVVAEQAGLTLDIGEEMVFLRKQTGNQGEPGQLAQPAAQVDEDVAFFEKKYQKKITGVKPKGEYSDPDQFYSAIGKQLGIPEIAWKAAAEKFGWKKDDGKHTFTVLKGGPTAGGGQGTWDVMFMRFTINPETKKPDPATMEQVMVQLDYDGNIKFPEIPKGNQ